MSYDISIRRDDNYSAMLDRQILRQHVLRIPNVSDSTTDHFICGDPKGDLYMEIDLELVSAEGDSVDPGQRQERNCIRIHVPLSLAEGIQTKINSICVSFADDIGWQAYDEQNGEYLR